MAAFVAQNLTSAPMSDNTLHFVLMPDSERPAAIMPESAWLSAFERKGA
jgi:hypothetical protein